MSTSRAFALRSTFRAACRRPVRTQLSRSFGRRGYASAQEHAAPSSELPWLIGSLGIGVPVTAYLWFTGPSKSSSHDQSGHDSHGHGKDDHGEAHEAQEEHIESKSEDDSDSKEESKNEPEEDKPEAESQDNESKEEASKEEDHSEEEKPDKSGSSDDVAPAAPSSDGEEQKKEEQ